MLTSRFDESVGNNIGNLLFGVVFVRPSWLTYQVVCSQSSRNQPFVAREPTAGPAAPGPSWGV